MKEGTLLEHLMARRPHPTRSHSLARMGGLASIPRRSPDDDAVDGQNPAAGPSDRADSSGADAGAWKERRRRRRERRRAANELEARSHVRVEMDIEIERAAESLDDRQCSRRHLSSTIDLLDSPFLPRKHRPQVRCKHL